MLVNILVVIDNKEAHQLVMSEWIVFVDQATSPEQIVQINTDLHGH
jgi:hypothetical protein